MAIDLTSGDGQPLAEIVAWIQTFVLLALKFSVFRLLSSVICIVYINCIADYIILFVTRQLASAFEMNGNYCFYANGVILQMEVI
jgi:hypothetical protein